jgi:hypothetical protein
MSLAQLNTPFGYIPASIQAQIMPDGPSNKRLIIEACRQILRNRFGKPSEKLKAAAILERMIGKKNLAPGRRRTNRTKIDDLSGNAPQPKQKDSLNQLLDSTAA